MSLDLGRSIHFTFSSHKGKNGCEIVRLAVTLHLAMLVHDRWADSVALHKSLCSHYAEATIAAG